MVFRAIESPLLIYRTFFLTAPSKRKNIDRLQQESATGEIAMSLKRNFGFILAIMQGLALVCSDAYALDASGAGYDGQNRVNYYYGYLNLPSIDYTNRYYSYSDNKIGPAPYTLATGAKIKDVSYKFDYKSDYKVTARLCLGNRCAQSEGGFVKDTYFAGDDASQSFTVSYIIYDKDNKLVNVSSHDQGSLDVHISY